MTNRCLICARETDQQQNDYHPECSQKLFGTRGVPTLDYELDTLSALAKKIVKQRVTIPGVQVKISLAVEEKADETPKLTIVGLWGKYILKPPSTTWPELPENEHCTLKMAEVAGIETVPYGLIRLKSGERAFISRRIDRRGNGKLAMEDMCQLTGRLTEDKYKGSHEQISRIIKTYTANPLLDVVRFFELTLFCYLTGNSDMHLKNFSLIHEPEPGWKLAPAYDLLSTRLVIPASADPEEMALTISGKKSNFSKQTLYDFGIHIGLNEKQVENTFEKLGRRFGDMLETVNTSFLSREMKDSYKTVMMERGQTLEIR